MLAWLVVKRLDLPLAGLSPGLWWCWRSGAGGDEGVAEAAPCLPAVPPKIQSMSMTAHCHAHCNTRGCSSLQRGKSEPALSAYRFAARCCLPEQEQFEGVKRKWIKVQENCAHCLKSQTPDKISVDVFCPARCCFRLCRPLNSCHLKSMHVGFIDWRVCRSAIDCPLDWGSGTLPFIGQSERATFGYFKATITVWTLFLLRDVLPGVRLENRASSFVRLKFVCVS